MSESNFNRGDSYLEKITGKLDSSSWFSKFSDWMSKRVVLLLKIGGAVTILIGVVVILSSIVVVPINLINYFRHPGGLFSGGFILRGLVSGLVNGIGTIIRGIACFAFGELLIILKRIAESKVKDDSGRGGE